MKDMSEEKEHECVFGEEQEPSGRVILTPCLGCGLSAMDAMKELESNNKALREKMNKCLEITTEADETVKSLESRLKKECEISSKVAEVWEKENEELRKRLSQAEAENEALKNTIVEISENENPDIRFQKVFCLEDALEKSQAKLSHLMDVAEKLRHALRQSQDCLATMKFGEKDETVKNALRNQIDIDQLALASWQDFNNKQKGE